MTMRWKRSLDSELGYQVQYLVFSLITLVLVLTNFLLCWILSLGDVNPVEFFKLRLGSSQ